MQKLWRDAKLYEIGAGTSEIRRMIIARDSPGRPYSKEGAALGERVTEGMTCCALRSPTPTSKIVSTAGFYQAEANANHWR